MKKSLYTLIIFCLMVFVCYANAETLTWQDCIDIANKTNNTLLMAKQDYKLQNMITT